MAPVLHTERTMLDLLTDRYTDIRRGTITDRWLRAEHVKQGLGYTDGQRIADFIAADKHRSTLALYGHEVKVSRSDWLTELKDPTKSEPIKRHMHHWYLVVPDVNLVKPGELPEDWGLMIIGKDGKLRAKKKAPLLTPQPLPLEFSVSLAAAAARTASREPLRRDAPTSSTGRGVSRCSACGESAPCQLHQPAQHNVLRAA